jgi:hypothetical protein
MTTEEERVQVLVREMYETAEKADWDLSPANIRAQRRRHKMLAPDPKALVLVAGAAALIITGFFVFVRPTSHKPAFVAAPITTTTTSAINPNTLAATLACVSEFAPGTSQPDTVLVGKSLSGARALIEASAQTSRIVADNGTCENVTLDLQSGRVDLWIIDGRVVKAVLEGSPLTTRPTTDRGAHSVTVPNVVDLDQSQAANALGAAGLNVGAARVVGKASIGPDKVVSESPVAGSVVAPGSSVDLEVSGGR